MEQRRQANYIWVSNNFIAYQGATYIKGFAVVLCVIGNEMRMVFTLYTEEIKPHHTKKYQPGELSCKDENKEYGFHKMISWSLYSLWSPLQTSLQMMFQTCVIGRISKSY